MVRKPAYSGSFYPASSRELSAVIASYLESCSRRVHPGKLRGLIVPHAGYIYSGPIAASAYARVGKVQKILLFGPSHRFPLEGMALCKSDKWETPLGTIQIDSSLHEVVSGMPGVCILEHAHDQEHSLEVQIPFLQSVLPGIPVLPVVVGHCEPSLISNVIDACYSLCPEILVICSSDLSHYLDYGDAKDIDSDTADQIRSLDSSILPQQACGSFAINGFIEFASKKNWKMEILDLRNSGDTAGSKSRVVGYGAFAAWEVGVEHE